MPPAPIRSRISYGPSLVPEVKPIVGLLRGASPFLDGLPVGIALGRELAAAAMEIVPASLFRQGVFQERAGHQVRRSHELGDGLEVLPRLLLGPGGRARRE